MSSGIFVKFKYVQIVGKHCVLSHYRESVLSLCHQSKCSSEGKKRKKQLFKLQLDASLIHFEYSIFGKNQEHLHLNLVFTVTRFLQLQFPVLTWFLPLTWFLRANAVSLSVKFASSAYYACYCTVKQTAWREAVQHDRLTSEYTPCFAPLLLWWVACNT